MRDLKDVIDKRAKNLQNRKLGVLAALFLGDDSKTTIDESVDRLMNIEKQVEIQFVVTDKVEQLKKNFPQQTPETFRPAPSSPPLMQTQEFQQSPQNTPLEKESTLNPNQLPQLPQNTPPSFPKETATPENAVFEKSTTSTQTSEELSTPSTTGKAPPPIPGPPPPLVPKGPVKSTTHRLMTNSQLKKFVNEPEYPKLKNEQHDFGKLNDIKNPEERRAYASEIEKYVKDLKNTLEPIKVVTKNYATVLERIKGKNDDIIKLSQTIEIKNFALNSASERLKQNEQLKKNEPYIAANGISFFPQADIDNGAHAANAAQSDYFQKQGVSETSQRSLEWKIEDLKKESEELRVQLASAKRELQEFTNEKNAIEIKENNGIPFSQWSIYIETKDQICESWERAAKTLKGEVKVTTPRSTPTVSTPGDIETNPAFAPFVALRDVLSSMKMAQQVQLKTNPDAFYRNTEK